MENKTDAFRIDEDSKPYTHLNFKPVAVKKRKGCNLWES
jgi:hypothetical protein